MKNKIILWISTLAILFVLSYLKNIFSENYPVTGTIGIDGEKLSYKLDKEGFGNKHKLMLRSDNANVNAFAFIQSDSLIKISFNKENLFLVTEFDRKITGKEFNYFIEVENNSKKYRIPSSGNIDFIFHGKISKMLSVMFYLFLFSGMILIIRSGLEYFNNNLLTKKLLVLSGVVWLTFLILINPLYLSYKFEYINQVIIPIQFLFPVQYLAIFMILVITIVLAFNEKFRTKPVSLIFTIISLILYMI